MNVHKNARQTPRGREWMVSLAASGQTPKAVSVAVGVCPRTVRKWIRRHEREGVAGLADRSSRPHRLYRPTPQPVVERIEALRRQRLNAIDGFAAREEKALGEDHRNVFATSHLRARVFDSLGRYDEALAALFALEERLMDC